MSNWSPLKRLSLVSFKRPLTSVCGCGSPPQPLGQDASATSNRHARYPPSSRENSLHGSFVQRLTSVSESVAIPVVVLEEHLRGWLARLRRINDPLELVLPYGRLVQLLSFFSEWEIASWRNKRCQDSFLENVQTKRAGFITP